MPIDYRNYHPDWKQISRSIRDRAGDRCEWCGVRDLAYGYRDAAGTFHECEGLEIEHATHDGFKIIRIVLTVAHLDHDVANNEAGNLACLCQKCHLNHDLEHHLTNAAETRRRKAIDLGQQELFA